MTAAALERIVEIKAWPPDAVGRAAALAALERGEVAALPDHGFQVQPEEGFLLDPTVSDGKAKNVSFDPGSGRLGGTSLEGERLEILRGMVGRFADWSQDLLHSLLPSYAPALQRARTSFRPCAIEGRAISPRKDDRRLHVDAFPSQPVQGRRILRVFANVDPEGRPRVWNVGEPFEPFADRFAASVRPDAPGAAWALQRLGLTRGRRTAYDQLMLALHDRAKDDEAWQRSAPHQRAGFAAGSSWIVFTDATLHAALDGQHALEQTFLLPVAAMADPDRSPLRVLERMTGRTLLPQGEGRARAQRGRMRG